MNTTPTTGSNPAPTIARQATAREFFAVLFRRKWIILGLFFVTSATVMTVAITTPTVYTSSGRILVKRGERQSALRPERQIFSDWEQELGSEMQVVKSVPVMKRARQLLVEESTKTNRKLVLDPASVDVEVMGKSNVLAVGYTNGDPTVAQLACAAVINAYVEYRSNRNTNQPQKFFDDQIADLQGQIDAKMQERRTYSEQTGVAAPLVQTQSLLSQVQVLEQRRSDVAADLAAAQTLEQAMRKLQADPEIDLPTFDGSAQFTNEQALITLKNRIVEQQARIAQLSETLREDSPEVVGAHQTLETLQALLKKEVDRKSTRLNSSHSSVSRMPSSA